MKRKPVAAAFIAILISLASAAQASASDDPSSGASTPCEAAAASVAAEAGASGAFDYACTEQVVTVETDGGDTLTSEVAADNSPVAVAADDGATCGLTEAPERTIVSETRETLEFCIFYGRADPNNAANSWIERVSTVVTINLQLNSHQYSIRTVGGGTRTTEWTGTVAYYDHPNPFYFGLLDVASFRVDDTWTPRIAADGFVGAGWGESRASVITRVIKLENMHVAQPARDFEVDIAFDVPTHRFICSRTGDGRCFWPDGQEAGFGQAG